MVPVLVLSYEGQDLDLGKRSSSGSSAGGTSTEEDVSGRFVWMKDTNGLLLAYIQTKLVCMYSSIIHTGGSERSGIEDPYDIGL